MQLKTTVRYPYIPIRVAKIKKYGQHKNYQVFPARMWKNRVIRSCWEYQMEEPAWKILTFSLKSKHTLTTESSSLHPWTFIQEKWKRCLHRNLCLDVPKSLSVRAKKMKAHTYSSKGKVSQAVVDPYHGIILSNKKGQTIDMCTNLDDSQKHCEEWKVARVKRSYTVCIHLHNTLEMIKL